MNKLGPNTLFAALALFVAAPAIAAPVTKTRGAASLCEPAKAAVIYYLTPDKSGKVYIKGQGNGWSVDPPNNVHNWIMSSSTAKAGLPGDVIEQSLTVTTPLVSTSKYSFTITATAKHKKAMAGATLCEFFHKSTVKDWTQVKKADLVVGDVWDAHLMDPGDASGTVTLDPGAAPPAGASNKLRVYVIIGNQYSADGFQMQATLAARK